MYIALSTALAGKLATRTYLYGTRGQRYLWANYSFEKGGKGWISTDKGKGAKGMDAKGTTRQRRFEGRMKEQGGRNTE